MIFIVEGQEVKVALAETLVSSSVNIYEAAFRFDHTWDEYTTIAVFDSGKTSIALELQDGKCVIPWEVLQHRGTLRVGVYGVYDDKVRPTLWSEPLNISQGVDGGEAPLAPTPSVYETILNQLGDVDAALDSILAMQQSYIGGTEA